MPGSTQLKQKTKTQKFNNNKSQLAIKILQKQVNKEIKIFGKIVRQLKKLKDKNKNNENQYQYQY